MTNSIIHFCFLVCIIYLVSCSSTQSIKISSNPPGADVFIKLVGKNERQQIGKTPVIHESLATLLNAPITGGLFIEIEKENYIPSTILIAELGGGNLEISQELKALVKDTTNTCANSANIGELNKGLDQLFEAQRLARVGRLEEAIKTLDELAKTYPNIAAAHEMRAGIYYLQKDYNKALDEYRQTLLYNFENTSVQQMTKRLEAQLGIKNKTPEEVKK